MARQQVELTPGRISSESVREATGRDWEEWLTALDRAGAAGWNHKEIVAHLKRKHPEVKSGWWQQSIAVGYERARGKRVLGETASAGFQLGVQRSVASTPVVKPGHRVRMTWHPEGWPAPATLQLTLMKSSAGKAAIHAHLEKLPDADARVEMRTRWRAALERLAAAVPPGSAHGERA